MPRPRRPSEAGHAAHQPTNRLPEGVLPRSPGSVLTPHPAGGAGLPAHLSHPGGGPQSIAARVDGLLKGSPASAGRGGRAAHLQKAACPAARGPSRHNPGQKSVHAGPRGSARAPSEAIRQYDEEITRLFECHLDSVIFASLPGAGTRLARRLLAGWGEDRGRYDNAAAVQALAGTSQSCISERETSIRPLPPGLRQVPAASLASLRLSVSAPGLLGSDLLRPKTCRRQEPPRSSAGTGQLVLFSLCGSNARPTTNQFSLRPKRDTHLLPFNITT